MEIAFNKKLPKSRSLGVLAGGPPGPVSHALVKAIAPSVTEKIQVPTTMCKIDS